MAQDARTTPADEPVDAPAPSPSTAPDSTPSTAPESAPRPAAPSRRRRGRRSWYRELAVLVLLAVALALLIKTFLIQAFYIPSPSMHPTLVENDRVLVNRLAYRFHPPRRGDVIVFQNPHPRPGHQNAVVAFAHWLGQGLGFSQGGRNKDYIKRVIGLPGDSVEIHQGVVFVNGVQLHEPYISPIRDNGSYGPYHVPQGCLFVLGDNRTDSDDSRGSLGFIPIGKVLGRAFVIVWPPSRWRWIHGVTYGSIPAPPPEGSTLTPTPTPTPTFTGSP